jgi:hypothetical protein
MYILVFNENLELRFKFQNAGMPDCPASSQSGTGLKKTNDAGTEVQYRTKLTQSGIFLVWYRTNSGCRNADASGSFLYADARLWVKRTKT